MTKLMWELVTNIKIGENLSCLCVFSRLRNVKKKDCLAYKKVCKFKTSLIKFNNAFKGVLHPWPVFWLFMHFSQKLQHIGNK